MTTTISEEMRSYLERATYGIDGSEPAHLVFGTLAIATQPAPSEGFDDPRFIEIRDLIMGASPEVRTRALQITSALLPVLERLRSLIITVKSECEDADVRHGNAEVLPEGWLVVTMGDETIGRVPYNPERGMEEASRVAEEILSEHVRLHVRQTLEPMTIPLPEPGETVVRSVPPKPVRRPRGIVVQ